MQKALVVLVAFLALAFAQSPQTSPLTVTPLTDGVTVTGTLPVTSLANAYHVNEYSFYVPENASSVNITFSNTDGTSCTYIHLYIQTVASLACAYEDYSSSNYFCSNSYDPGDGLSGTNSYMFVDGANDDLMEWAVGTNWYIGIGRYSGGDYDSTCSYSLYMHVNSSCPTGSIGLQADLSDYYYSMCSDPYTVVSSNTLYSLSSPGVTDYTKTYKLNVATPTVGHIFVTLNSTSTGAYIYGKNFGGPSEDEYNCEESGYTNEGNYYIYTLFCYTPRKGNFYFVVTDDNAFNATISFVQLTCPDGMGGYNCTFQSVPYNASAGVVSFSIPYNSGADYLSYPFYYMYIDIPANYSAGDMTVTADSPQSGYMYIRRDGYPEDDSEWGYEDSFEYDSFPAVYGLNQFDYLLPGRIYFGFECTTTGGCNVTLSSNISSTSSSGSSTLTTMTTTAQGLTTMQGLTTHAVATTKAMTTHAGLTTRAISSTTSSQQSSAFAVVPSIVAVVAAFLALF
jgi:hypothetical protein